MLEQQSTRQTSEITFVERLARELGVTANAANIYAAPIERDGVTVIPVAKAVYGLGGGSGKKEKEQGYGGGGGVALTPVGYIEIKNGATRFRHTRDTLVYVSMIATAAPLVMFAVWQLSKAFRKK